jgi:DNA-binding MarR family transcriptional regulator
MGVALRGVDPLEVSLPQFRLLLALHELGRSTSGHCAQVLRLAGSSVTRLADRLDASGHRVRGTDPSHRRVVTLELAHQGRAVVKKVTARRRRDLTGVLDRLDPTERAACAAELSSLHALLDEGSRNHSRFPMPL